MPFNDLGAVARVLAAHPGEIAGMILEPLMMNAGIIHPQPGYLAGLKALLHEHDVLLTFDEVKTGLTVGPGGVTAAYGVIPDLVCLAKAMGGGVSTAAIGGTAEVMGLVADGTYEQVGTFNGNPLAMAAARAMLTEVADDAAYDHLERLGRRLESEITAIITSYDLPWHVVRAGAKGCIAFRADPIRNYRDFLGVDETVGPGALAGAAQRRRLPAAVGQDRAVAGVGPAHRCRRRQVRGECQHAGGTRGGARSG